MRIAVIGAGYVGITTAACLATIGHLVYCAENNPERLAALRSGRLPLFEPCLAELVGQNRSANRLGFGSTEAAVAACEAIFICVGTPLGADGEVDLSAVELAARTVRRSAHGYRLIVQKSTVPVGTSREIDRLLAANLSESNGREPLRWDVAASPEFLREGSAVADFLHPDRVIIGAESERAARALRAIYDPIITHDFDCPVHGVRHRGEKHVPVVVTDTQSAELIKHTANSFLAMKISFINMVSDLCEAVGGDVQKVVEGIGLDQRIGPAFLRPGIGFGGSCFPKDVQGFIHVAEKHGCNFSLLKEVERINQDRVDRFVAKVKRALLAAPPGAAADTTAAVSAEKGIASSHEILRRGAARRALAVADVQHESSLKGKTIGVWGLAFKPDTDDIRNSPAVAIVRRLLDEGAQIRAYDPQAMKNAERELPDAHYCGDAYEAAVGADALLVLTEWREFSEIDLERVYPLMVHPLVIDGRSALSSQQIGRKAALTSV